MEKPILRDEKGRLIKGTAGRPKGASDKITKTVKETFQQVFNDLQKDPKTALKSFAKAYPRDFHQIVSKLIPTDIKADITAAFQVEQITGMKFKDGTDLRSEPETT